MFWRRFRYIMVPTTLGKDYLLKKSDHESTLVIEAMLARVKPLERDVIAGHAKGGSVASVRELATYTFDSAAGSESIDLRGWRQEFTNELATSKRDRDSLKKKRDKMERTMPNAEDRVLPFTIMEKIEAGFFIFIAVLLWVVGYLSLVQILRSLDIDLPTVGVYLLPIAGVTAIAVAIKAILASLRGLSAYKTIKIIALVLSLGASVVWLFLFSSFVQEIAAPLQFMSLQGGAPIESHTSMAYIIAGVLAEALGAGTAWAYVSDLFYFKTVRSTGINPDWKQLDDVVGGKDAECENYERLITLCDSLAGKIEAARGEYVGRAEALYMQLRVEK